MHPSTPTPASVSLLDLSGRAGWKGLTPMPILADGSPAAARCSVAVETATPELGCLTARACIRNEGNGPLRLRGIRWTQDSRVGSDMTLLFPAELAPRYYASENARGDYFGVGTTAGDTFLIALGNQTIELGHSEDHVFPGLFVGAASEPLGLFCAQASQTRLSTLFRFKGRRWRHGQWFFEIDEIPVGVPALELAPGEALTGETLFFAVLASNDPQESTGAYYRHLRAAGAFARRALNPLPSQRIYCTWNYDFFADIDEAKVLSQIPILKREFPSVRFVQIDDGYQHRFAPETRAMIDLCYGLDHPFDRQRFPHGPRWLCEQVRAAGLRPAIWLGLWACAESALVREHPDWLLLDESGRPFRFDQWYGGTVVLDPSVAGVREYLDRLGRTVFGEWGFEGVKLDFSSFAFNARRVRYREPGRTAVEWRHELESIFRRHLPADGFFGWCVVAGTAQPFLSQADYFRNAIDIGHGNWDLAKTIATWSLNTNILLPERPCLPNIDSIGWSDRFDDAAWESWLTLCAVTGMGIELSGDLRKSPEARRRRMARTLELSNPDRRFRCLDFAADSARVPPSLWLAEGRNGDRLLAVFNWNDDEAATVPIPHDAIADSATASPWRDAWTGRTTPGGRLPARLRLPPRASRLFACGPVGLVPGGGQRRALRA